VQCYSGGFANTIFNEGQPAKGATAANRCGFFATVQDRTAAGCTPDIQEDDYKEYSSYFWAALWGKTRSGAPVSPPDLNLDGRVSFDEAHAYALMTSDTIDISIKTSGVLLRSISRNTGSEPGLLTAEAPYPLLAAAAVPTDRAVLDGLSAQLGLSEPGRAQQARQLSEQIQKEIRDVKAQGKKFSGDYDRHCQEILGTCKMRWPELANRWDPKVFELLQNNGVELVATVEQHPQYSEFQRLHDELDAMAKRKLDLERRWAKTQRLLRIIENITLAANLKLVTTPDAQARYRRLIELEAGSLADRR
jgi:hypothetical protein